MEKIPHLDTKKTLSVLDYLTIRYLEEEDVDLTVWYEHALIAYNDIFFDNVTCNSCRKPAIWCNGEFRYWCDECVERDCEDCNSGYERGVFITLDRDMWQPCHHIYRVREDG